MPLAYNKDFQEDKEALFDVVRTSLDCLEAMAILLEEGIRFRPERLEQAVASDFSNATDVADYLVARDVPFREAYQLVGRLVKFVLGGGNPAQGLTAQPLAATASGFEQDIYDAIAPGRWWLLGSVKAVLDLPRWRSSSNAGALFWLDVVSMTSVVRGLRV